MSRRPTVADAEERAFVTLTSRGWRGVLFWVDKRRGLGKVQLASGKVLRLPLDDLELDVRTDQPEGEPSCTPLSVSISTATGSSSRPSPYSPPGASATCCTGGSTGGGASAGSDT